MSKRQQRRQFLQLAGVAASVIAVGGVAGLVLRPRSLTCAEVVPHLPAYAAGTLDESLRERIADHLLDCPNCSARLAEITGGSTCCQ